VQLRFVGSNPGAGLESGPALPGTVSYFTGKDPARWHTALPTFASIAYADLYPGIRLTYAGTASQLKGTYTLAPGTDPTQIRWRYEVPSTEYRVPDEAPS